MAKKGPVVATLTPQELEAAIQSLSKVDMARLHRAARMFSQLLLWEPEDLLQEAFLRALRHSRRCPRDLEVVHFLIKTMKGIASDEKKKATRKAKREARQTLASDMAAAAASAEKQLGNWQEAQRMRAALKQLFADEPLAQIILEDFFAGVSPEQTQKRAGITRNRYASERKKIRRRIRRLPKGWKP